MEFMTAFENAVSARAKPKLNFEFEKRDQVLQRAFLKWFFEKGGFTQPVYRTLLR